MTLDYLTNMLFISKKTFLTLCGGASFMSPGAAYVNRPATWRGGVALLRPGLHTVQFGRSSGHVRCTARPAPSRAARVVFRSRWRQREGEHWHVKCAPLYTSRMTVLYRTGGSLWSCRGVARSALGFGLCDRGSPPFSLHIFSSLSMHVYIVCLHEHRHRGGGSLPPQLPIDDTLRSTQTWK